MYLDRVLIFRVLRNDSVGGDRAGVRSEFIPSGLCAGHVQIGSNGEQFLRQRFAKHGGQPRQLDVAVVQEGLNSSDLFKGCGEVDLREQCLYFRFRHAAVQQGLDLRKHGDILRKRGFVHASGQSIQIFQQRGLVLCGCSTVFAQLLCEQLNIRRGLLDVLLLPYRHNDVCQKCSIFHRSITAVFIIPGV